MPKGNRKIPVSAGSPHSSFWAAAVAAGVDPHLACLRIRRGWTAEQALGPAHRHGPGARLLIHDGLALSVAEWAHRLDIPATTLRERLRRGWTADRALTTPVRSQTRRDR